jgi:hypothetical protein
MESKKKYTHALHVSQSFPRRVESKILKHLSSHPNRIWKEKNVWKFEFYKHK